MLVNDAARRFKRGDCRFPLISRAHQFEWSFMRSLKTAC
jgi:hypothetical protein